MFDFDRLVGGLDYPMYVVTGRAGDVIAGCLVGFLTQTSIEPPRVLVCISRENHTADVALRSPWLIVHILREDDGELASWFGEHTGRDVAKFTRVRWQPGPEHVPVLDGLDWFGGPVLDRIDGLGDHTGYVVAVTAGRSARIGVPQLGYQAVRSLDAANPA